MHRFPNDQCAILVLKLLTGRMHVQNIEDLPPALVIQKAPCVHILSIKRTYEQTQLSELPVRGGKLQNSLLRETKVIIFSIKSTVITPDISVTLSLLHSDQKYLYYMCEKLHLRIIGIGTLVPYCCGVRGFSGASFIGLPWCRQTAVFRTAVI